MALLTKSIRKWEGTVNTFPKGTEAYCTIDFPIDEVNRTVNRKEEWSMKPIVSLAVNGSPLRGKPLTANSVAWESIVPINKLMTTSLLPHMERGL